MPLPRVRFTVRRMMIVVAIAAIAVWLPVILTRRAKYHRLAREFDTKVTVARALGPHGGVHANAVAIRVANVYVLRQEPGSGPFDCVGAHSDYYAAMKAKYERAARYPFLPVAPDPPEPE
jgi:hypothetical protein